MSAPVGYTFRLKTFRVTEGAKPEKGKRADRAEAAFVHFRAIFEQEDLDLNREHFVLLALNARGGVTGFKVIGSGSTTACIVHPRDMFRAAIALDAVHLIVAHNHPSGDPSPSPEDIELTRALKQGGALLGLPVVDHLVLAKGPKGWTFQAVPA